MCNTRKGFTLIELLIVVAIIAILAAIAVPNFLEAQTRAKVSRVKSDLRSLAVAEEAYRVDWNSYTHKNMAGDSPWGSQGRWGCFGELTTPVAYITTIPRDPFGWSASVPTGSFSGPVQAVYELGCGADRVGSAGTPWSPGPGMPSNVYQVESDGPDHWDDSNGNTGTSNFPWTIFYSNTAANIATASALCYDPTNGTVSVGEIYRVGGMKPSGQPWDVYWANGSR